MEIEPPVAPLECVLDRERARALLHPTRLAILAEAREPVSATEIARRLGAPRQRVNHHVRALARHGLLRRAGRRRKRNMIEQRYRATALAYVFSPEVLGPLAPGGDARDRSSAATLMALAARLQRELGRASEEARGLGQQLPTWSLSAGLRFTDAAQRAGFVRELERAVLDVVARHAGPAQLEGSSPAPGRPYRLMLACWPTPPAAGAEGAGGARASDD